MLKEIIVFAFLKLTLPIKMFFRKIKNYKYGEGFILTFIDQVEFFAEKNHNDRNLKYDSKPYKVHLKLVVGFGSKYLYLVEDIKQWDNVLGGAWGHDLCEDANLTRNDIQKETNEQIANLVYALTNEKGRNRKERANGKYYEGIKNTPYATYIKICDRMANVSYSKQSKKGNMFEMYKKENEDFITSIYDSKYEIMFNDLREMFK